MLIGFGLAVGRAAPTDGGPDASERPGTFAATVSGAWVANLSGVAHYSSVQLISKSNIEMVDRKTGAVISLVYESADRPQPETYTIAKGFMNSGAPEQWTAVLGNTQDQDHLGVWNSIRGGTLTLTSVDNKHFNAAGTFRFQGHDDISGSRVIVSGRFQAISGMGY